MFIAFLFIRAQEKQLKCPLIEERETMESYKDEWTVSTLNKMHDS